MGTQGNEQFMRDLIVFFIGLMSILLVVHFGYAHRQTVGFIVHVVVQWIQQEAGFWTQTT